MAVAGLIFSNIHNSSVPELTSVRTIASIPFGCRYRLIDFPLSSMVNSGVTKIGVIAHNAKPACDVLRACAAFSDKPEQSAFAYVKPGFAVDKRKTYDIVVRLCKGVRVR